MPETEFPKFDGEHPRLWKCKCEKYFEMFRVPIQFWAQCATLHFHGNAALWLQTFEAQHAVEDWVELCVAIDAKFGKDLYHNYMKTLLNTKQLGGVQEYYDQFQNAIHKVLAHNRNYDDAFFVNKFVEGLKGEIRTALCYISLALWMQHYL